MLTYTEAFRPLEAIEVVELAHQVVQATTAQSAGRVGTKK